MDSEINTMSNITQVINVDKNMKMLKKSVHASDTDQLLNSTGPFTIFAPSDLAFEKLEAGLMDRLLEPQNRARLADLLQNHVVTGSVSFAELKDGGMLTTVNGKVLMIGVKNGQTSIGDIPVFPRETKITNGVMYLMDTVIQ
jgi:uncharacterized surface protein with fasciclin (FAS1) repeats